MSLDAMPQLPAQMIPRFEKLMDKVKSGEVTYKEVMGALTGPLMKKMMPIVMSASGEQIADITPILMSRILPGIIGKKLFIRVRGSGCFICEIGYLPKVLNLRPSSPQEIVAAGIPGVDLDPEISMLLLQGYPGIAAMVSEGLLRIYGLDVIAGWFKGEMMNMMLPMIDLLTKKNLGPLQDVLNDSAEKVLSRYGV